MAKSWRHRGQNLRIFFKVRAYLNNYRRGQTFFSRAKFWDFSTILPDKFYYYIFIIFIHFGHFLVLLIFNSLWFVDLSKLSKYFKKCLLTVNFCNIGKDQFFWEIWFQRFVSKVRWRQKVYKLFLFAIFPRYSRGLQIPEKFGILKHQNHQRMHKLG